MPQSDFPSSELLPDYALPDLILDDGHSASLDGVEIAPTFSKVVFDSENSLLNRAYQGLATQYDRAREATSDPEIISKLETLVDKITNKLPRAGQDSGIQASFARSHKIEEATCLTYLERRMLQLEERRLRERIGRTKARAHRQSYWLNYGLALLILNRVQAVEAWIKDPARVSRGVGFRHSIGAVINFFALIRRNIGYSIAIALYGPFTFYFITQPLNPHAMAVVAKIRSAYFLVLERVSEKFSDGLSEGHRPSEQSKSNGSHQSHTP